MFILIIVGEHIVARDEQELPDEDETSASRGKRSRDLRLRKILDYIQEKSRVSSAEILEHLNKKRKKPVSKRVLQFDLSTLRLLDTIELEDMTYSPKVTVRKFSEGDLGLALRHSRKLLRPWTERYDNRYFWLDLLVRDHLEAESPEPSDEMCLLQHLKSGYYRDIYERLLEYRRGLVETGLSEINLIPILGHSSDLNEIRKRLGLSPFPSMENHENALALTVDDETLQKIADIRDLLIGKLMSIEYSLQNEIPLKSRCDYCPHLEISIIE